MKEKATDIKDLIQEYLLDEGLLRNKLPDTEHKLEFGFQFVFPPGPVSQKMVVFKPKTKDLIVISNPIQIAPQHVDALNAMEPGKKLLFFMELRKFFLAKDVFYRIDTQNNRYEISDQIFIRRDGTITKNSFYNSIRKVFTCSAYSNIILNEYCYGKIKSGDDSRSDDFSPNFTLYS